MADITMCKGSKDEVLCKTCYRKNAIPNEFRQSYFIEIPIKSEGTCEYHWEESSETGL